LQPSSTTQSESLSTEDKNHPTIGLQQKYNKTRIHKPKLTDENHNDCFIEAHNKELEEQRTANEIIILIRKERNTIV
jgi:hypothetical protein